MEEKEETEWIRRALEIDKARAMMLSNTDLSSNFVGFGGVNEKKRAEFMRPLYELHDICAETFMDYNADAFNSVCVKSQGGCAEKLLLSFWRRCQRRKRLFGGRRRGGKGRGGTVKENGRRCLGQG